MFLAKALEKILSDKSIKKSQYPKLKASCTECIEILKTKIQPNAKEEDAHLPPPRSETGLLLCDDKFLEPFSIACSLKITRFSVLSIDCLQKLIAYGHVPNDVYDSEGKSRIIDRIVNMVCNTFDGSGTEDPVQLQIMKALLTIITSPSVAVHEKELLLVIRTVYNIFMATKNPINQATAKATLTQMLSVIFQRMEDHFSQPQDDPKSAAKSVLDTLLDRVCPRTVNGHDDSMYTTSEDNSKNQRSDSMTNLSTTQNSDYIFTNVHQRDGFLVFRSLCLLAMKPFASHNPYDPKSHELRSKILSLQLILSVLQDPGPVFRSDENFIMAIKQYLCVALSKNGVCPVTEVFELTLAIFLSLLNDFKQHLKMQIEVFFKEIFLYVLENPQSSLDHKWIVVESLARICSIPQSVVDIYLNYDCDLSLTNIFERLVIDLAKLAQGRSGNVESRSPLVQNQELVLRVSGLRCLVHILKCMVTWSRELYRPAQVQSYLGTDATPGSEKQSSNSQAETSSQYSNGSKLKDDPEQFESLKARKGLYEAGLAKFNQGKHVAALKFLQEQGLVGESVESVAAFLHDEDRLDQASVGDFLGDNSAYTLDVMYAFVDRFDFHDKDLVASLREFLAGFRLPGEAQKIDRLMEKFAARYCECNPKNQLFASADTAYVLAFSIIMLTTDLHSSQIKQNNRMTKSDYIKMNRGINDSKDLPEDYLGHIYDQIAKCEIKLNKHRSATSLPASSGSDLGVDNGDDDQNMRDLMASVSHMQLNFMSATHSDHVRPMFKLAWTPFLAAFSVGLQDCDDAETTNLCLEGIKCAIRIACIFRMEIERDAYVQALTRFTLLLASSVHNHRASISSLNQQMSGSNPSNEIPADLMKPKNVDSIRALITIAQTDGNYLGHAWLEILRCISQLESAQLISSVTTPERLTNGTVNPTRHEDSPMTAGTLAAAQVDQKKAAVLHEVMSETGSTSVVVAVDKIFSGSVRLDGDAIVEFVKALCQVSREELSLSQPRMFSLQKVVEISYYNMGRIRLQWSRIWEHVGAHFTSAGRSHNENVAIFVVDSLRQLSVKLIEKGELPNFHFQKEFLRPFVSILDPNDLFEKGSGAVYNSPAEPIVCEASLSVQDMVIRCINQLVFGNWKNLRSGWTNLFMVFQRTALSPHESIVELAFQGCQQTVEKILEDNFDLLAASFH
ncbi:Protein transport protein sec71, partial [Cichlidogyrus casuarinus]